MNKKAMGLRKVVLVTVSIVTALTLGITILIGYFVSRDKIKAALVAETEQALSAYAEQVNA